MVYTPKGAAEIIRKEFENDEVVVVVQYPDGTTDKWTDDEISY